VDAAWKAVERNAARDAPDTDPALVAADRRLPARLYWSAVRRVVPVSEAREHLRVANAVVRTRGSDRGLVGAAAAVAWPGGHPTWELLAYRSSGREAAPRFVDAGSVRAAQRRHPELFLCYDPRTRRLLVAPHTPCPILFGLRATDPAPLVPAAGEIRSEPVERWMIFRTNQGTGDHLAPESFGHLAPFSAGALDARVAELPRVVSGGHVRLALVDRAGAPFDAWVFEPTKTLPPVARALVPGDRLRVWGGRGADAAFRVEGLDLLRLVPRFAPPRPPVCPSCGRRAESTGRARGYRCRTCRRRWPPEAGRGAAMTGAIARGRYHPTPSARRHLAPRGPEPEEGGVPLDTARSFRREHL
jgi:tRNA(Ile2)-agmatinylcytidine synthase